MPERSSSMSRSLRQRVLEVLFPRQQHAEKPVFMVYDEDAKRYVEVDVEIDKHPNCSICLEPIGEGEGVSTICNHLVRGTGLVPCIL